MLETLEIAKAKDELRVKAHRKMQRRQTRKSMHSRSATLREYPSCLVSASTVFSRVRLCSGTLALRLAIPLVASPDGMLSPTPSLTPIIDSSLRNSVPPTSLAVLEDVPRRFQLMLADGFDLERAVEALVQAVFGEV